MTSEDVLKWLYETRPDIGNNINIEGKRYVLGYLYKKGKTKSKDLAISLNVSTSRIAVIINDLEEQFLVKRITSMKDRRQTFITLTDKGLEFMDKKFSELNDTINEIINKVGEENLKIYMSVTNKIKEIVGEKI